MKGFFFLGCAIILPLALQAAPVGNTASPKLIQDGVFIPNECWVNLRIGYEGDFVGDARLKQSIEGCGRVDTFQQNTNAATVSLNILERLDLFGVFGSSRVCADWRFQQSESSFRMQIETFYRFLWGVGGRGILLEWGCACLGLGGYYSRCKYTPSWIAENGTPQETGSSRMRWRQWQFDIDLSYQIDLLTPYLGIKYSQTRVELGTFSFPISSGGQGFNHFESKIPVGLFVGCSLSNGKYFMLNVEGRFFDEYAATISGDLRF